MKTFTKIAFCFFLTGLFFCSSEKCFSQRAAGQNSVISGAENVGKSVAQEAYKRIENRTGIVQGISNKVAEAKPLVEKAIPIARKGIKIGKKILAILKKILR